MKKFIRRKWRQWSGLEAEKADRRALQARVIQLEQLYSNLVSIGVDVHFNEPHMILVYSKINGGQLRHIEADFKDLKELNAFTQELRERYQVCSMAETWDISPYLRRENGRRF